MIANDASAKTRSQSVTVPMVYVRIVLMTVAGGNVGVRVGVRLGAIPGEIVLVAMMLVVRMGMRVRQRFVMVQVPMALGEMQGDAGRDQRRREPEKRVRNLAEQCERHARTDKRRGCKIGTGSRCP